MIPFPFLKKIYRKFILNMNRSIYGFFPVLCNKYRLQFFRILCGNHRSFYCFLCTCICSPLNTFFSYWHSFITSSANFVYSLALLLDLLYSTTGILLSWDHSTELSTLMICSNTWISSSSCKVSIVCL